MMMMNHLRDRVHTRLQKFYLHLPGVRVSVERWRFENLKTAQGGGAWAGVDYGREAIALGFGTHDTLQSVK